MFEENNEIKKKTKLPLLIIVLTLILVLSVGGVYAYFSARATNSGSQITGRTLDIGGTTLTIAASRVTMNPTTTPVSDNLVPAVFGVSPTAITTTEVNRALTKQCSLGGYTGCHVWKITASSSTTIASANIKLNLSLVNVQNKNQWSYVVYRGTDSASSTILHKGSIIAVFPNTNTTIDIHSSAGLTANTPAIYYVMVYLNNTDSVQNDGETTNTTDETGTYNGSVVLEAMGGEVKVEFYKEPTNAAFFDVANNVTYTVTNQSACESYLANASECMPNDTECISAPVTLCSGGEVYGYTLGDVIADGIPSSDYVAAGLSDVNITTSITKYHGIATYTVSNQSSCINYLRYRYGYNPAVTYCNGGSVEGNTLGDLLSGRENIIPSSDYATAGLSNVSVSFAPTEVVIPDEIDGHPVTAIGSKAFYHKELTSVTIPDSVTTIGASAFYSNQLTLVEIPNSVTTIGASAFRFNQLLSINIPNSVTAIDDNAFDYNNLTSITIENENTTIGNCAFGDNPPLGAPFLSNYQCARTET